MTAISMPKFNLNKKVVVTQEELDKAGERKKYLEPGMHDVKVTKIENLGAPEGAPTWLKIKVTMEALNEASTNELLLVPTDDVRYPTKTGKNQLFALMRLQAFFEAIGEKLTPTNVEDLLNKYISGGKLLNKELSVVVGYESNYSQFVDKDKYHLADKDGLAHRGKDGEILVFNSRDEVKVYAKEHAIPIAEFSRVIKFVPKEKGQVTSDGEEDSSW